MITYHSGELIGALIGAGAGYLLGKRAIRFIYPNSSTPSLA
tara:strand:- start:1389 stop:1511 length:123 start_codon:yes stop_codon:yes gene_type:complete